MYVKPYYVYFYLSVLSLEVDSIFLPRSFVVDLNIYNTQSRVVIHSYSTNDITVTISLSLASAHFTLQYFMQVFPCFIKINRLVVAQYSITTATTLNNCFSNPDMPHVARRNSSWPTLMVAPLIRLYIECLGWEGQGTDKT